MDESVLGLMLGFLFVGLIAGVFLMEGVVNYMVEGVDRDCKDAGFAWGHIASDENSCIDFSGKLHRGTFKHGYFQEYSASCCNEEYCPAKPVCNNVCDAKWN